MRHGNDPSPSQAPESGTLRAMCRCATPRLLFIALLTLIPLVVFGRIILIKDPKTLIADSKLVFVGQVRSVKASGIATSLSYPTMAGASFPWLRVEMEVLAPFKGVKTGDIVQVMMLSMKKDAESSVDDPPMVLEPDSGDVFFLCLGRTPLTNTFAALTAPYDEFLSVLPLHRSRTNDSGLSKDFGRRLLSNNKQYEPIWELVDEKGELLPDRVAKLRKTYAAEIRKVAKKDMVYLEWQSLTNAHGWFSDVPKGFSPTNSNAKNVRKSVK